MTTEQIYLGILAKPNCSCYTAVGLLQDLHKYAANTVTIITATSDPENCDRALLLKEQMKGILENYDRLRRGVPNAKNR